VVDSAVYAALEGYIALPHRGSGTKGVQDVPGGAAVGTKGACGVPGAVQNGVAGTKGAGGVPGGAVAGTNKGVFVPDGGKNAVLGNTDPSGSIYGRKVERNRYMCNLNTADSAALVQLYGIGGYYARKILRYREVLGGSFVDARQLLEIEGFTQERFARIEKNVFVSEDDVKGFSILNAERKALERHPYIGPYAARGIVTYLKLKGKESFENEMHLLEQLVKEKIIGEGNAQKLREYLLHL
jgi:DNA uptake protein ComE-like DNA-binding protein